jgi:hypothetical protein
MVMVAAQVIGKKVPMAAAVLLAAQSKATRSADGRKEGIVNRVALARKLSPVSEMVRFFAAMQGWLMKVD